MSKCLRCGAGSEWLQGSHKPDDLSAQLATAEEESAKLRSQLAEAERKVRVIGSFLRALKEADVPKRVKQCCQSALREIGEE